MTDETRRTYTVENKSLKELLELGEWSGEVLPEVIQTKEWEIPSRGGETMTGHARITQIFDRSVPVFSVDLKASDAGQLRRSMGEIRFVDRIGEEKTRIECIFAPDESEVSPTLFWRAVDSFMEWLEVNGVELQGWLASEPPMPKKKGRRVNWDPVFDWYYQRREKTGMRMTVEKLAAQLNYKAGYVRQKKAIYDMEHGDYRERTNKN